jgi:Fe-S-cluster containining protein
MPSPLVDSARDDGALCRSCGACCAFSHEWPRFSTEDDAEIERIPAALRSDRPWGMRCVGDRCTALRGEIGVATSCAVYADRPDVCRSCEPGDDACRMARRRFGLSEPGRRPVAGAA